MTPLYVFDFDKTLIPFDSFRRYLFYWVKFMPFAIIKYILLRKFRIYNSEIFKLKIIRTVSKHPQFIKINRNFVDSLIPHVDFNMIHKLTCVGSDSKLILILSASPDIYIYELAKAIGIVGKGSYFVDDHFIHLYGKTKLDFLKKNYPFDKYRYVYSISDSKSDLELLKVFESYDILLSSK